MSTSSRQFNFTPSERRASTTVSGSLSRSGLYVTQDFFNQNVEDALNESDSEEEDQEVQPLYAEGSNHRNSIASSFAGPIVRTLSHADSRWILNEETKLMKQSGVPIRRTSRTVPSSARAGEQNLFEEYGIAEQSDEEEGEIKETWDEAVRSGKIRTTPLFELKSLIISSIPLIITFLLQSSLSVCSVFAVGHISSEALAGVTLGMMYSNMTAIAVIAGLASSLDTFLPQAYGARKYHLVGLIFQRCVVITMAIMLVICLSWWLFAEKILLLIVDNVDSVHFATTYLKITCFGIPGYILFETGKRFLQAQGIFEAPSYVLFVCAPLNAALNYFMVWTCGLGYIGAPIAVAINYTLMAAGLFAYTITTKNEINPLRCWNGIHMNKLFKNWGELIKLSIPNLIMIVSEFLSFEILTLMSSYLGTEALAAQSVISTMASVSYQVPYGLSIAASTRIANFLGAQLAEAARTTSQMVFIATMGVVVLNVSFLYFGRAMIANWFTDDPVVKDTIVYVLQLVAPIQIFDALNATSAGCLRGQGMQKIGGYCNVIGYYVIGIPLGYQLAFYYPKEHPLGLFGEWIGVGSGLVFVGVIQTYVVLHANYQKLVDDAVRRSNTD